MILSRAFLTAVLAICLGLVVACNKKQASSIEESTSSRQTADVGPWRMDLQLSPAKPSMTKPMTFTLHIVDQKGQPVSDAQVTGALTMKTMDMGVTQVKFTPKGSGNYETTLKSVDMSGPWNLAIDASAAGTHTKKNFEITIYD